MANTYYPDISSWNAGIKLTGWLAVMAKATEGTGYISPVYGAQKSEAARCGAKFGAYHFLYAGNGSGQADFAHSIVGSVVPLMLDFEETPTTHPVLADAVAFVDEYRKLGGVIGTVYLPQWYWQKIGSPLLSPLATRNLALVSSVYPSSGYTDNGPGWGSYGGMAPIIWQYTSSGAVNGTAGVDLNCFRGPVSELWSVWMTGTTNGQPTIQMGASGPAVVAAQTRLNVWGAKLTVDGQFGAGTDAATRTFQTVHKLASDGVIGPATWAALDANPVPAPPAGSWAYSAPGSLAGSVTRAVSLSWDPATAAGQLNPASYTVELYRGAVLSKSMQVTATTLAIEIPGLSTGPHSVVVYANGSPTASPHATFSFVV